MSSPARSLGVLDGAACDFQFVHVSAGVLVVSFVVQAWQCNLAGNLHGAFYALLADQLSTIALMSAQPRQAPNPGVSVHLAYPPRLCLCLYLFSLTWLPS